MRLQFALQELHQVVMALQFVDTMGGMTGIYQQTFSEDDKLAGHLLPGLHCRSSKIIKRKCSSF